MLLIILAVLGASVAHPQNLSPELIADIFGTPPPRSPDKPQRLEDITVSPTTISSVYTDSTGAECKCVPYYLCDKDDYARYIKNASVTGWGQLDIRFGQDECQESVEKCCKDPVTEEEPVTPLPPVVKGCGYRNPNGIDFNVVGGNGNEAQFGEFPWVVAIMNSEASEYIGVGVLIHPQVVLTGAIIAIKARPEKLLIRAGEWDTQTVKERLKHQERMVSDVVTRQDFHRSSLRNDIAVLRLVAPVQLDQHINVLCLPQQDEDFDTYKECYANGWGKDVFGKRGRYAVILKKVVVDMVPFNQCAKILKTTRLGTHFKLHESFVCAGGENGIDTCQGDGGAPLACPTGEKDRYKLAGLVAWGIGCGEAGLPGVYVRVSMFSDWINGIVQSWGLSLNDYA